MIFLTKFLSLFKPKPKLSILQIACNSVAAKKLVTGSRGLEGKELEDFFQKKGLPKLTKAEREETSALFKRAYLKSQEK